MSIITKPAIIEKNVIAEITLDKSVLAAVPSVSADEYFNDSSNWEKVLVYYRSFEGKQREILVFDATQNTPVANFLVSEKARNVFQVQKIVIKDFDNGTFIVERDELVVVDFDIITNQNLDQEQDNLFTVRLGSTPTGFNGKIQSIIQQTDGKLVVGGDFTSYGNTTTNRIARLNIDGSLDTSFVIGTGFNNPVTCIIQDSNGRLCIGGAFTSFNNNVSNRFIVLNTDGTIYKKFTTGFNGPVNCIVQNGSDYLVGGDFTSFNNIANTSKIMRFTINSRFSITFLQDNEFTSYFTNTSNKVYSIIPYPDGSMVIAGVITQYGGTTNLSTRIIKLLPNGVRDAGFSPPISAGTNIYHKSMIQTSDGKIIVGMINGQFVKLNTNGSIDTSFVTGTGFDGPITSITQQTDGKILVAGNFTSYNNTSVNNLVRLNANGSIDTSFVTGTGFINGPSFGVNYVVIQESSGKLVVGGNFTGYNEVDFDKIIRLELDGSLESI